MNAENEISYLFFSLPEKYDAVTGALENLPSNELTLSVVKSRLIAEETKNNCRNDADEVQLRFIITGKNSSNIQKKLEEIVLDVEKKVLKVTIVQR